MITWILMVLDLLSLVSITLIQFKIAITFQFVILSSGYLISKGIIFRDNMSLIDLVCGFYILIAFFLNISSFIYYLIVGWFAYKLIFTIIFASLNH